MKKPAIDAAYARQVLGLEDRLNSLVVGQPQATRKIGEVLTSSVAGLKGNVPKPMGVFFLTGPTGVGKTETGFALAKPGVFYPPDVTPQLVTLNMADYQHAHEVAKLVGSPPGYVYCDVPCALDPVRTNPHTVFIVDEIEKAHPDIPAAFLAIFDKGRHRSGIGQEYTFEKSMFILTSNAPDPVSLFAPEFRNRLDAIITYEQLQPESYVFLIRRKVNDMSLALQERFGARLQLSSAEATRLAELFHAQHQPAIVDDDGPPSIGFGRPLGRVVAKLENPFAQAGLLTPGTGARELSRIMEKAMSSVSRYLLQEIVTASDHGRPNRAEGSIIRLMRIVGGFEAYVVKNGQTIAKFGSDGIAKLLATENPAPSPSRPLRIIQESVRMMPGQQGSQTTLPDPSGTIDALQKLLPVSALTRRNDATLN